MKLYTVEQRRQRRQQRAATLVGKDKLTRAERIQARRLLQREQEQFNRESNHLRRETQDIARTSAKKRDDRPSAEERKAARPALRSARKFSNSVHRESKKLAAMLSEDRKRSYLATYTEERKAARRAKLFPELVEAV
jgi:hypothetical protein